MDVQELKGAGIEAVRVYGRRHPEDGKGMFYDPVPLLQSLSAILGQNRVRPDTRRNTVDALTVRPNPALGS